VAIHLSGLSRDPPSQEAAKRRAKACHRQLPFCGATPLVGVVYTSHTTWASLAFPKAQRVPPVTRVWTRVPAAG
jgi:hypothetical protein